MTKLEEILKEIFPSIAGYTYDHKDIIELKLREYAEFYAKKCLEIAANEAEVMEEWFYNRADDEDHRWVINKDSILNIKLPDHDNI